MEAGTSTGRLDRLERRLEFGARFVPYLALAVSAGLAAASVPFIPQPPLPATLAVTGVAGLWVLWWVSLHPGWKDRRGLMAIYFAGLVVLIAVLVVSNPFYGFFAFTGYLHTSYALRGRWRVPGV